MTEFRIGQKWISNAEPELGMGRITGIEGRAVHLVFDLPREQRTYAISEPPLTRVRFNAGDEVRTLDDVVITITRVSVEEGILIYHGDYLGTRTAVIETELDPNVLFSKPQDRLFTHQLDANHWFNLRYETWRCQSELVTSPARGLYGARAALIPHQLYVAAEVGNRFAPRVLLADEVGLGKTIEAGLILHQQLVTGRAKRVLIIVPPALTFQWFIEMIRRFNLQFVILDEDRCQEIVSDNTPEEPGPDDEPVNPFEAQQLMLCGLSLLQTPERLEQALAAEWDLIIVDEAHHLAWSEESVSEDYHHIEQLASMTRGLLLLTATPEQLGRAGHFARLRLLDSARYHSFSEFQAEEAGFTHIAQLTEDLMGDDESKKTASRDQIKDSLELEADTDLQLIDMLLDRHGTGRVLLRNIRSSVSGFPARLGQGVALTRPKDYAPNEPFPEVDLDNWPDTDPRVLWLVDLLTDRVADKFLLICAHQETAMELEAWISSRTPIRSTVFHEGMDLVARDRAAAWFAESYRGAQLLVCSEIGSEGRNFQFASNLILFDLPTSPDLLEQRIGRLDRIGQAQDVNIYVPYFQGSASERLFRFYDEGLSVLTAPNPVAQSIADDFIEPLMTTDDIDGLMTIIIAENKQRRDNLSEGRDRLLELSSHRPAVSTEIVEGIANHEGGHRLEAYMELSFDAFGLESDPLEDNIQIIRPTESMIRNATVGLETQDRYRYPELPEDGIRITYDREMALSREDVHFMPWENPITVQAMDLLLSDTTGNACMVEVKHPSLPAGTLLVEVLSVDHVVAPPHLMADRYLPPVVSRVLMTPKLMDIGEQLPYTSFSEHLIDVPAATFARLIDGQRDGIETMLASAVDFGAADFEIRQADAGQNARTAYDAEIARLVSLKAVNPAVRTEEIDYLREAQKQTLTAIADAVLRTDAVRVIVAA
ncbi:MAG: RNA polymerase-associated protein RapA [Pseudomonadales bacterium]|nr:RNA polymerase-associated protein RapA [Pseudomonadales bacterium]